MLILQKTLLLLCLVLSIIVSACGGITPTATSIPASELQTREAVLNATFAALNATLTPTIKPTVTPSPTPTITPTPSNTPTATATRPPTKSPTDLFNEWAKTARILLHEDVAQSSGAISQIIKRALDEGGYKYESTEGLIGRLKEKIDQEWDLVIIAAEMKANVQGEFFLYANRRLRQGSSLIMETWLLDKVVGDDFNYMLDGCGLEVQSSYTQSSDRGVRFTNPDHPLLQNPNPDINLEDFNTFWNGDLGDLLRKKPGSSAEILGSMNGSDQEAGLLTTCMGGRLILQTFSTHDHKEEDMVALWQNYIAYALKGRYDYRSNTALQMNKDFQLYKFNRAYVRITRNSYSGFAPFLPYYHVLTLDQITVNKNPVPDRKQTASDRGVDLILSYEPSLIGSGWTESYLRFPLTDRHLNSLSKEYINGTIVILEKTAFEHYPNKAASAKFLAQCGLKVLSDYTVGQLWPETWLVGPNHSIFGGPNKVIPFIRNSKADRLGSLLTRLPPDEIPEGAGRVEFLAGVDRALTGGVENGFITSCHNGTLIIVSLDSEMYDRWMMFQLWDNLINFGLLKTMDQSTSTVK